MEWTGTWRNQYGSTFTVTDDTGGRLTGSFRTAIESSPFFGADVPLVGVHAGVTASFSSAVVGGDGGDGYAVNYTGKLEDDRLETLWFVVDGSLDWWRSVTTNHDTFTRVAP